MLAAELWRSLAGRCKQGFANLKLSGLEVRFFQGLANYLLLCQRIYLGSAFGGCCLGSPAGVRLVMIETALLGLIAGSIARRASPGANADPAAESGCFGKSAF